jgi:hypothetical protein
LFAGSSSESALGDGVLIQTVKRHKKAGNRRREVDLSTVSSANTSTHVDVSPQNKSTGFYRQEQRNRRSLPEVTPNAGPNRQIMRVRRVDLRARPASGDDRRGEARRLFERKAARRL